MLFFIFLLPLTSKTQNQKKIEFIRIDSTPYNQALQLSIQQINPPFKEKKKVVLECQGFALGQTLNSKFDNYNLRQSPQGSRIMVCVLSKNKMSRFYLNRNNGLNISEEKSYRKRMYTKKVPSKNLSGVKAGPLVFLVFPVSSYSESVKAKKAHALMSTSYKSNLKTDSFYKSLSKPLVIYNQPTGTYKKGDPILIDFYLLNCVLSRYYGYTLLLEIKNKANKGMVFKTEINHWSPYLIKNFDKGTYVLNLTLLYRGKKVSNPQGIPSRGVFTVK